MRAVNAKIKLRALTILVCLLPLSGHAFDISFNGFGSAAVGQALSKDAQIYPLFNTHPDFTSLSLMGLNIGAKINDDFSFAGQIVALGNPYGGADSFTLNAQWATATYTPMEGTSIKVGRQLLPTFMASEYIHVGYLLPFQHMPITVFELSPATRLDGASLIQSFKIGSNKLSFMVFGGTALVDIPNALANGPGYTLSISGADEIGGQIMLDGDGWRLKAFAARNYLSIKDSFNFASLMTGQVGPVSNFYEGHLQTFTASFRYDKNNIVTWAEWFMDRMPDGAMLSDGGHVLASGHGYYILGGYRFGKFLPRYTFAQGSQNYDIPPLGAAIIDGKVTSHTFGLNYQAGSQAVIKVEYEHNIFPSAGGGFLISPPPNTGSSADTFYAGVDFIF